LAVRGTHRRLLALCLAASAVITGVASSHASTADRLDRARARLAALSGEIEAQSKAVEDARAAAADAQARAAEADQALVPLVVHRVEVAQRVAAVQEQQAALVREQQAMDALDQARSEIVSLIDRLRAKLAPKDVQEVARAFQGDHNISYGSWSDAFLQVMGAPRCRSNLVVTIA